MSVESAIAYIKRMRSDESFRNEINECEDEQENWNRLTQQGYEFTMEEFHHAKDAIYKEHGIVPQF
jgi:predicted ribosomally synthesized peptide with nif11-like leader